MKRCSKLLKFVFFQQFIKSGGVVTTKMAAEIASSMAVGLLAPVAGQIDLLRLGELSRSMEVAYEYGIRLNPNLRKSIKKLVSGYSSHSFVIDREEAKDLFRTVREPTEAELILEAVLYECARSPASQEMIFSLDVFLRDVLEYEDLEDIEDGEEDEQLTDEIPTENGNVGVGKPSTEETERRNFEKNQDVEETQSLYTR